MKTVQNILTLIALLFLSCINTMANDEIGVADSIGQDTVVVTEDVQANKHDTDAKVLNDVYAELADINSQIKDTHNWLIDLNFMSPGVERKIQLRINSLNDRLDNVSTQLNSITDKDVLAKAKPYKVSAKDCRQDLSKCSKLLKKKSNSR